MQEELILSEISNYLTLLNQETILLRLDSTLAVDMWAAVQRGKGAYHADHVHEDVFVSGAYYAAVPDHSAPLVLKCPSDITPSDPPKNDGIAIHPKEGDIIIFPPWLLHGVPPSQVTTESPRVSFAFNLSGPHVGDPWEITRL